MSEVLLEIQDLKKHFKVRGGLLRKGGTVRAVDGVSFSIAAGETFALVGKSGCGKTTIAKMVLMLEAPTDGAIRFAGQQHPRRNGGRPQGLSAPGPGGLPGSLCFAQPAAAGTDHHRRATPGPWRRQFRGDRRSG